MLTFEEILKIKALYQDNQNIIQYIKHNTDLASEEAILHSYDLQAGSYIKALEDEKAESDKKEIGLKLAGVLKKLSVNCICEAGVGEATTLLSVLSSIEIKEKFGFDISMSPLLYGQKNLKRKNVKANLFCAELSRIPFANNSIECIFTFHAVANNGKKEKLLLQELLRVTEKYLILVEPDFNLFGEDQKKRMEYHGYSKCLPKHLSELGANIIHYEPWELDINPLNKASIIIVEKKQEEQVNAKPIRLLSPISYQPLIQAQNGLFCKEDGFFYPIVNDIPILLREKAILISHYESFMGDDAC